MIFKLLSIWKKRINSDFFQDNIRVSIFAVVPRMSGVAGVEQVIFEPHSGLRVSPAQNAAQ